MEQQLLKVDGKIGERVVRFGSTMAKALRKYLKIRTRIDGNNDSLWLTEKGATLKDSSYDAVESHRKYSPVDNL